MEPSVATLVDHDRILGAAALIDDSGLFVAGQIPTNPGTVEGRLGNGQRLRMKVIRQDEDTGLVLLQAEHWVAGDARPFSAPMEEEQPGGRLLAVLKTGPIRAEFVSSHHYGVLGRSHRLVPLSEFRFEAPAETIGSALIFCENGEIIGALSATLRRREIPPAYGDGLTQIRPGLNLPRNLDQHPLVIGPSEMTVAYTVGPEVVRQVIEGFRTPSHEVSYPSLGVLCVDNIGGGAVIEKIQRGSAAAKAGLKVGDVIQDIGETYIRDQVAFAKVMFHQQIGSRVMIRISRGREVLLREVTIGRSLGHDKE